MPGTTESLRRILCGVLVVVGCNGTPPRSLQREAGAQPLPTAATVPDAASTSPGSTERTPWRELFTDLPAPVLSVWALAVDQAFFVGERGLVLERRVDGWYLHEAVTTETLWWVWGHHSSSVFAGGEGGTLLHFDGLGWTPVPAGLDPEETVWGIWGDDEELWVAGGRARSDGPGFLLRFRAGVWSRVAFAGDLPNLYKVWGRSAREVFVAGGAATLLHFDGDSFTELPLVLTESEREPLFTVAGNDDGVVLAVGGLQRALAFERVGLGFQEVPFATGGLNGVSVAADGAVAVVGPFGVLRYRVEDAWLEEDVSPERHYHAVAALPGGAAFAVGGDLFSAGERRKGSILARGKAVELAPELATFVAPRADAGAHGGSSGDPLTAEEAGVPDVDASLVPEAESGSEDGAVGVLDAGERTCGVDAACGAKPTEADASARGSRDAATPRGGLGSLCTDAFSCDRDLECWYLQGDAELRCLLPCSDASECERILGAGARCAPPGCQTSVTLCLAKGWQGCSQTPLR